MARSAMASARRIKPARRVKAVVLLFAVAASARGAGVENEALANTVSVALAAPSIDGDVSESSLLWSILPKPGRRRLRSFLEAMVGRIKRWFTKDQPISTSLTFDGNDTHLRLDPVALRRLQAASFPCRPSRRPGVYGRVPSIPPQWIVECKSVAAEDVFKVNHQIVDISYAQFRTPPAVLGLEALMLAQKRGPVQYIEVISKGDFAHYEVNAEPKKTFRDHSCLNRDQWCFVARVQPIEAGILVIDRHRIIHYNYTWRPPPESDIAAADIPDVYVSQFGEMNSDQVGLSENAKLKFPTAVAEYIPYNMSLVSLNDPATAGVDSSDFEITPLIPHAWCKLLFVTDTGNHRVVMLNASNVGQFDYIGQFGLTGKTRANSTGFNWPWGVAVYAPAWEGRYEQAYANVFVVDRRNHRLVKLNLGYPLMRCIYDLPLQEGPFLFDYEKKSWMCRRMDKPRLYYSGEYGRGVDALNRPSGLTDPTAVAVFNHYIIVCEVGGNAITLLRVDHQPPYGLKFVTYFKPAQGVYLQGGMSMSPWGYIWYNYVGKNLKNYFTAMFLPEVLRESKAPSRFQDFLLTCINTTWYDDLIPEPERFVEHMQFMLNASVINWIFPDKPNFVDLYTFNMSGKFNIKLMNQMLFNGSMQMCAPPTTPTPPAFFGGNADGWVIDGKSQSEFTKRSTAPRSSHVGVFLVTCCISALSFLVLSPS